MQILSVLLLVILPGETLTKEPQWGETSPTQKTGNRHDNVVFYMERKYHPNGPRLINMTLTFTPQEKGGAHKNQNMTLWIKPYKKETGFHFHFHPTKFQENIVYIGDKELIEIEYLVYDLTPDKVGKYAVELKFENNATLVDAIEIKLHEVDVTTPITNPSTKIMEQNGESWTKFLIVLIALVCTLGVVIVVVSIVVIHLYRQKEKHRKIEKGYMI